MKDFLDGEARDKAIHDQSPHLLVEAGAGTGKTSVLVSKIVYLLKTSEVKIAEIAAITFTESAAAELRERLGAELNKELDKNGDNQNLLKALSGLPAATITTIHGFAHSLLQRYAHTIGIPFGFSVIDESAVKYRLKNQLMRIIYKSFDDEDKKNILLTAQTLGVTDYHLNELWKLCNEKFYKLADHSGIKFGFEQQHSIVSEAMPKVSQIRDIANQLKDFTCESESDKLFLLLKRLASWQSLLPAEPSFSQLLEWLLLIGEQKPSRTGNKANWPDADITELRNLVKEVSDLRKDILQNVIDLSLPYLAFWMTSEAAKAGLERKLSGELRFQDLLVYCYELLEDDAEVRGKIALQYKYILVDEFQDTDELQLSILGLLADLPEGKQGSKLFYVGDPKQSIYRFRGADVGLYRQTRSKIANDLPLQLVTNFRSRSEVLETVNRIFTHLIQANGDLIPGDTDFHGRSRVSDDNDEDVTFADAHPASPGEGTTEAFQPLVGARSSDQSNIVFLEQLFKSSSTVSERRQRESEAVVAVITEAVSSPWMVGDDNAERPADFSDIAIVIQRRTGLNELRTALERARIPYQLPSSDLIFANQFVQDLLACIRAVVMPYQEYYILGALRTIIFGCSDIDLQEYKSKGGTWQPYTRHESYFSRNQLVEVSDRIIASVNNYGMTSDYKVYSAMSHIYYLHNVYKNFGIPDMVAKLVDSSCIYALASLSQFSYESKLALDYIINKIISYAKDPDLLPQDLLDLIEAEKGNYPRAELFEDYAASRNAVKVVTIHGAKGLEYPIVILTELGAAPLVREKPNIILDTSQELHKGSINIRINEQLKTSGYDEATDEYERLERAELYRLLYVAATRARDHLVISLSYKPSVSAKPSLAEVIHNIVESDEYLLSKVSTIDAARETGGENKLYAPALKSSDPVSTPQEDLQFLNGGSIVDWQHELENYQKEKIFFGVINMDFLENIFSAHPVETLRELLLPLLTAQLINFDITKVTELNDNIFINMKDAKELQALIDILIMRKPASKSSVPAEYSDSFEEKNIYHAYQIYEDHILNYLEENSSLSKDVPIIFSFSGITFESMADICSVGDGGSIVLDYSLLTQVQKGISFLSGEHREVALALNCFRLGFYSLAMDSVGDTVKNCLFLYPISPSSCTSLLISGADATAIFQELLPAVSELLCQVL